MRKIIFLLVITGLNANMSAQVQDQRITEHDLQSFSSGQPTLLTNMDALYEGVKGTPYFIEDFETGDIYFLDGTEIAQINIRYNIYKDELEFRNSTSGMIFVIDRKRIKAFVLNESGDSAYFEYFNLKPDKPGEKSLVQVLNKGETRLLLKHKKQFIQADYKGAYSSGEKYDEFQDDKDYYLVKDDNETVQRIRLNKKSVLKALGDNQSVLKEFSLMKKIDFSNPGDIVKLLEFYDRQKKDL